MWGEIVDFAYWVVVGLFLIGFFGVLTDTNLIKIAIGLNIMEASLLLLLVRLAFSPGDSPPIVSEGILNYADPVPQALTLTAIVIGASTTALLLSFIIKTYKYYGSVDLKEIRRMER